MTESKLEKFLKDDKPERDKTTEKPDLRTTLEKELEEEDSELGKELQRSRAEEIIARRRVAIAAMRAGQVVTEAGGGKADGRGREWLVDIAEGLLKRGLDQRVVGGLVDYLLGTAQAPVVGLPGAPAPAQGMSFTDMMAFYKIVQESSRTDPAIAAILDKLAQKLTDIETRIQHRDPPAKASVLVVKADGSVEEVEAGKPIVIQPKADTSGKPLEVVREENRHAEKMEEIKTEKEFKESVSQTLASVPESFAAGLGALASTQHPGARQQTPPGTQEGQRDNLQQQWNCKDCHTPIYFRLGETRIICPNPKCRAIWELPQKTDEQQPE